MRRGSWLGLMLLVAGSMAAPAQESASFRLKESTLNYGGDPVDGASPASASLRISLDALGAGIGGRQLTGPSFRMDANFVPVYRPPGEVTGLAFGDAVTLSWGAEASASAYSVYRDALGALEGLGYGSCLTTGIDTTMWIDADVPPPDGGYFYLITSSNRLDEEGTKGFDATGGERPNPAPCP